MGRYILSDLKHSMPKFSDLLNFPDRPIRPFHVQTANPSKSGFTMILPGDELYEPEDGGEPPIPGARHRVIVHSACGRPKEMQLERDTDTKSML
jgi:hypothetical protein